MAVASENEDWHMDMNFAESPTSGPRCRCAQSLRATLPSCRGYSGRVWRPQRPREVGGSTRASVAAKVGGRGRGNCRNRLDIPCVRECTPRSLILNVYRANTNGISGVRFSQSRVGSG
jgi:hypothetical protein